MMVCSVVTSMDCVHTLLVLLQGKLPAVADIWLVEY